MCLIQRASWQTGYAAKSVTLSKYSTNKIKLQDVLINNALGIISFTGPGSSVVSASGNGMSRVRSRAATYQSRKKWY